MKEEAYKRDENGNVIPNPEQQDQEQQNPEQQEETEAERNERLIREQAQEGQDVHDPNK